MTKIYNHIILICKIGSQIYSNTKKMINKKVNSNTTRKNIIKVFTKIFT